MVIENAQRYAIEYCIHKNMGLHVLGCSGNNCHPDSLYNIQEGGDTALMLKFSK